MTPRRAHGYSSVLVLTLALACGHTGEEAPATTDRMTETTGGSAPANEVSATPQDTPSEPPTLEPTPDIFAEDLAQTPYWVQHANSRRRPLRNLSIQIPNAADELANAAPLGPNFVGVLLCEIEVTEHKDWDSPGLFRRHVEPDIIVLGGSTSTLLQVKGPQDTYAFVASYANVQLDHGFVLHVRDHDTNRDDSIESIRIPVPTEATPFVEVTGERTRARCGGVPLTRAVERAEPSFAALEPLLRRLEARSPAGAEEAGAEEAGAEEAGAEEADRRMEPARRHVRAAASWLGWAHPSVRSVVGRLNVVAGLWAIADAETRVVPTGTESEMPRVTVNVLGHSCSEGICQARVHATYPRIGPVISFIVLTGAGELVATEVASEPLRPPSAQSNIHTRDSEYTHTFEWARVMRQALPSFASAMTR